MRTFAGSLAGAATGLASVAGGAGQATFAAALLDHDVLGLQIAVDHPGSVRLFQRRADLHEDADGAVEGHRPLRAHRLVHVLALEQLHDDEGDALLVEVGVGDVDDVLVTDRGGRARHHEALLFFVISGIGVVLAAAPLWVANNVFNLREAPAGLELAILDFFLAYIIGNFLQMAFRFWALRRFAFPEVVPVGGEGGSTDVRPTLAALTEALVAQAAATLSFLPGVLQLFEVEAPVVAKLVVFRCDHGAD